MLSGDIFEWGDGELLLAFGTPITPAAEAAFIVSQSIVAAESGAREPIAKNIESVIAVPVERRTVRAIARPRVNGMRTICRPTGAADVASTSALHQSVSPYWLTSS
jgi:hypothetical protein